MAVQGAAVTGGTDDMTASKAVGAAVIGNVLEWYDFSVYGYLATILARRFFPAEDPTTALLATFAAFGIGFERHGSAV